MTDILEFSPKAIMAMGIKRITPLVAKYGITSPEVLAACKRWGGMLDEVNYPDSTCRWCGVAVFHAGEGKYVHADTEKDYCATHAGATATPVDKKHAEFAKAYGATDAAIERSQQFKLDGTKSGRLSKSNPLRK